MLSPRKAPSRPSWLWTSRAYPFLEIVVVGTGDRTERLQPHVLRAMPRESTGHQLRGTETSCDKALFAYLEALT